VAGGGGTAYTDGQSITMPVGGLSLYAQWTINQYTVTFDKNGGDTDANPASIQANYNTTVTLPAGPTKAGYTFNGWNTLANGTGSAFTGSTAVTGNVTVYAQWTDQSIYRDL